MSTQEEPTLWQKENDTDSSSEASDLGEMGVVDGEDENLTQVAKSPGQNQGSTNYLMETFSFGKRLAQTRTVCLDIAETLYCYRFSR